MAGKKPVWVDEEAHIILKQFAKVTKNSMVDVASRLVLDKLSHLEPGAGLTTEVEPGEAAAAPAARPSMAKPVTVNAPQTTRKRRPLRTMPDPNDADVRYVGGLWLV